MIIDFIATLTIVNFFVCLIFASLEQCASKDDCNTDEIKPALYSSYDNSLISFISKAEKDYKKCTVNNCSCFLNVVQNDLLPFKDGITFDMLKKSRTRGVKYQIIDSRLYRDKECMFPSRCSGVEHFLNSIRNELPNLEIIINVKDWPQVSRHFSSPLPVFSFSKTNDYYDIMYPAWSFWEGGPAIKLYPTGIGRWDKFRESLKAEANKWPWDKKNKQAFFRGSRTSNERDSLILLSRRKPELINAAYTKNQAWKSEMDTLGMPPAEEVSLSDHCHYRYLFNFRGVAASFRLKFLFVCKSLVLHVGDEWLEFFYTNLKPWIHYIPVKSGTSQEDLENLLTFLRNNEEISKKIALEGHNFVWEHLDMNNVKCYWKNLLLEYSKYLHFKPTVDNELIDVTR